MNKYTFSTSDTLETRCFDYTYNAIYNALQHHLPVDMYTMRGLLTNITEYACAKVSQTSVGNNIYNLLDITDLVSTIVTSDIILTKYIDLLRDLSLHGILIRFKLNDYVLSSGMGWDAICDILPDDSDEGVIVDGILLFKVSHFSRASTLITLNPHTSYMIIPPGFVTVVILQQHIDRLGDLG
jgi:hypothetical protein